MYFTSIIAVTVLAFSSAALAAPYNQDSSTVTTATGTGAPTVTVTLNPLESLGLSKTQQVLLSDTRVDALNNVLTSNEDFKFSFLDKKTGGPGRGGEIVAANRKTFPALTNTGVGAAVAFLKPCGFNTPHVHPRATELAIVVQGTVVSSMFPENQVNTDGKPREILNTLKPFDTTVFYQGSVHSQFNPDCEDAVFVAAFNSEDAGTGQVAQELFGLSNEDLTAAIFGNQIDGADVDKLKSQISTNVALGVEECLKKCNIPKRK
ncbi:RmlC-like cupin domain-containing protein [Truncatella angustata]|uniref:RmlC-like cupin domain-containing protein n=1 Tax=Truncatella angustata TaxID=152316 RepID=A0A9P9A1R6_9PEZI|nr:RmlC-like cupin domain-containing protein [Truncatella angustata]KAH6659851.1 RmlC-like cupin domain-containing protein [Truncatella angustata]